MDFKELGRQIKLRRERLGLSQAELGEEAAEHTDDGNPLHYKAVSRIENGEVLRLDKIEPVALALGEKLSDLLREVERWEESQREGRA